jgi:photosystem II stability/assembly factor-like uncharacterized protein
MQEDLMEHDVFKVFKRLEVMILLVAGCLVFFDISVAKIDPGLFSGVKPRALGPANMSGRISDIDVVAANPNIIYVGTATGGVWKSENGGISWKPIFDDQSASSIGAVAADQQNPDIVWVGTGEGNPRNSAGVGRGVFKSLDAGKTWLHLGLEKTEKINRILLHPTADGVAYAAALGTTWGENPERGVFKTSDGGKTWKKVLYVDQRTGAADLVMAPDNPQRLIAALWEHRRWPWFFKSGGPDSGLYITSDGGENWKKLTPADGLPPGDLGRIGIAFAQNKPHIVYALVEAKKSVLLRSEDGGFKWKTVNSQPGVHDRPFYYSGIRVNPRNENIIYCLQSRLRVSEDAGRNFSQLTQWGQSHSDYHAMWIHPAGELMVVGNDGGIVISPDRGKTWRFARNLPLGQFYHISYDMDLPYHIYGGLQDNGSWRGPSSVLTDQGIFNYHWRRVGGGDGFDTEPDPEDSTRGYAMSQGGSLIYFDSGTGKEKDIRPSESDVQDRYNWNAGFAQDPFEPATIYYGSQFVHRSRDRGQTWEIISPDLTSNDPEKQKQAESGGLTRDVTNAENYTTILCIAPSPVQKGVIWVGTDDGHVQLTTDAGKTWKLVSAALKEVPANTWVPHVEASKFNPACAFVVFDDHRRANWTPYVYVSEDWGKSWKSLVTKEIDGFVHVIEQDPVDRNLLFLGTEFGFYMSLDRGKEWIKWSSGFPTVPVRDLAVQPRDNDLIVGTHGRSIYILDDISFLREIDSTVLSRPVYLFKPADAYQFRRSDASAYSTRGDTEFMGQNRDYGVLITYYYNSEEKSSGERSEVEREVRERRENRESLEEKGGGAEGKTGLKIEILDEQGKVINELKTVAKKGINRIAWDLREKPDPMPDVFPSSMSRRLSRLRRGLLVLPGTYTVRLQLGDTQMAHPIQVKSDPRYKMDMEVLKSNNMISREVSGWRTELFEVVRETRGTGKIIKMVLEMAADLKIKERKQLQEKAKQLEEKLKALSEKVIPDFNRQGIFDRTASLGSRVFRLYGMVADSFDPLTQAAEIQYSKTKIMVQEFLAEYNKLYQTDVEEFKKLVTESGISLFKPFKPINREEKK